METLTKQLQSIIDKDLPLISNLSNASSVLNQLPNINWCGFYLVSGNRLILGPFQGEVACTVIPYATDVFVLDISRKECIEGILERIDQPRDDIPWIETEEDATELIAWTAGYGFRTKDEEMALLDKNKNHLVVHTIKSRQEMNDYLSELGK